jgi:hypothetical protein
MNIRDIGSPARFGAVFVTALLVNAAAFAADISADSLKLAPGVAKAAGYEAPATTYIVANSTNVYSGPSLVDTKVTGELKRGDRVDVLAKVKGWEWALWARTERALATSRYRCCRRQTNTFREQAGIENGGVRAQAPSALTCPSCPE